MSFVDRRPAFRAIGSNLIELLEPIVYESDGGWSATVPAGMVCDGASVPGVALSVLKLVGGVTWPDLVVFGGLHDAFYRRDFTIGTGAGAIPVPSRWWADREACRALATLGTGEARCAPLVRSALVAAGWTAWHKKGVAWKGP